MTDTTNDSLISELGNLGELLKASDTPSGNSHDVTLPDSAGSETTTPPVTPVEIPTPTTEPSPIVDILNTAAAAAATVVADTAPITDFATPVKVEVGSLGDTSRVRIQKGIIDTYVEVVAPGKPINWEVMSNHHIKLCKALIESAGYPYIEFKEVYDHLLKKVKEHRAGAFGDLYVRRFDDRLYPKMTKDQIGIADRLISIITTVGRHNDRGRALQQIDLSASLKDIRPALAQQNLSAYFGSFRR